MLLPFLHHVVALNDGNCDLTIPVIKGSCIRDALPHAFHIGVFKFDKTISTAIKHIFKECANIVGCIVGFDTDYCSNFSQTVPVIVIESMVTRSPQSHMRFLETWGM